MTDPACKHCLKPLEPAPAPGPSPQIRWIHGETGWTICGPALDTTTAEPYWAEEN